VARLIFEHPTKEQMEHIYKAEEELAKANITFDSGSNFDGDGKIISRDWELDWSLKGAVIKEREII